MQVCCSVVYWHEEDCHHSKATRWGWRPNWGVRRGGKIWQGLCGRGTTTHFIWNVAKAIYHYLFTKNHATGREGFEASLKTITSMTTYVQFWKLLHMLTRRECMQRISLDGSRPGKKIYQKIGSSHINWQPSSNLHLGVIHSYRNRFIARYAILEQTNLLSTYSWIYTLIVLIQRALQCNACN